jgi:hypothetical protein
MTTVTKRLDLAAITARAAAATAGPWRVVAEHGRDIADEGWSRITIQAEGDDHNEIAEVTGDDVSYGSPLYDENAEFIAHARTDVLALLDHVRQSDDGVAKAIAWIAEEYRRCVVAARCTMDGTYYATCNGRAEAYRQAVEVLADLTGVTPPDFEQIRREVPADGIYRTGAAT